jgi:hypothetical protein
MLAMMTQMAFILKRSVRTSVNRVDGRFQAGHAIVSQRPRQAAMPVFARCTDLGTVFGEMP